MKIAACAKIVPATDTRISIAGGGQGIDESGVKWIVSPYDSMAIEEAVKTKEAHKGSEVVLFTVGGDSTLAQLRPGGLAVGADRAVLITDPAMDEADNLGVAKALAKAIEAEGMELVFCGKLAVDDDAAQVPAMLAELLGWAQVSFVTEFSTDGSTYKATRAIGGGVVQEVSGSLPVVITAERGLNEPRYAKLPAIMKAKRKKVAKLSLAKLGLSAADVAPQVTVSDYALPPAREACQIISGEPAEAAAELARRLRDEAKVI